MRRRRAADAALSFFAFQDVMLGVIGVVILLTIVLLLQRATGLFDSTLIASATSMVTSPTQSIVLQPNIVDATPGDRAVRRLEMLDLKARLDATAERLNALRVSIRNQTDDLALGGASATVEETVQRLGELQAELADLERRRRVTYLLADRDGWTPLVIEISHGRAVTSRPEGDGAAFAIQADSAEELARRIARFALAERRDTEYLLLVVKPSGIPTFFQLPLPNWKAEGVPVGIDLITERSATTDAFPAARR
jgi:hypothetical protein